MSPITRLQEEARKQGWLSAPFSQSEQPKPLAPSGHLQGVERIISGGFCFGLSMVWIGHRLRGSAIDFRRAEDRRLACIAASNIQIAMSEDLDLNESDRLEDIDRFAHTAGAACLPGSEISDKLPRWWDRIDQAIRSHPPAQGDDGPRLFYLSFDGRIDQPNSWAHATAFEADGPVFRFFDPNYGLFHANGRTGIGAFVRWFFGAAAYREMQARTLRIIRMRRTS
jgi:hypothetical protein